jgi:cyclic-di-GMP-binding protein
MAQYSFDIVSEYDKAEMNNVFMQAGREISNRYDFKNTPAGVEWMGDKVGFEITGNSDMQIEAITDIIRRGLIARGQSTKALDVSKDPVTSNLKMVKELPFVAGLDSDKAKAVSKVIRESFPKVKSQIQGEAVRVMSASRDELQQVMKAVSAAELDFPIDFTNYR